MTYRVTNFTPPRLSSPGRCPVVIPSNVTDKCTHKVVRDGGYAPPPNGSKPVGLLLSQSLRFTSFPFLCV